MDYTNTVCTYFGSERSHYSNWTCALCTLKWCLGGKNGVIRFYFLRMCCSCCFRGPLGFAVIKVYTDRYAWPCILGSLGHAKYSILYGLEWYSWLVVVAGSIITLCLPPQKVSLTICTAIVMYAPAKSMPPCTVCIYNVVGFSGRQPVVS